MWVWERVVSKVVKKWLYKYHFSLLCDMYQEKNDIILCDIISLKDNSAVIRDRGSTN